LGDVEADVKADVGPTNAVELPWNPTPDFFVALPKEAYAN
jgi:hypothetical protein